MTIENQDVFTKYKTAGEIARAAFEHVRDLCVPGARIIDVCTKGDEFVAAETAKVYNNKKIQKGLAFPTTVSVNSCIAHFRPLSTDAAASTQLNQGDVAKIVVGAHLDGYPVILGETIIVGGETTPELKDALTALHYATEAAVRKFRPGNKSTEVSKVVETIAKEFGVTPIEGLASSLHEKDTIDGKKKIVLNPSESERKQLQPASIDKYEVYGIDIILVPGESGKTVSKNEASTIFKKSGTTYQLKLKTSRQAISEIQTKTGQFPFSVELLSDQRRARIALQEPLAHGLVHEYNVEYTKSGKPCVQSFTTIAITPAGITKLAGPKVDLDKYGNGKEVVDQDAKATLAQGLKPKKKKEAKETEKA